MATLPIPFPARKGRPRKKVDTEKILALRASGLSWRKIAQRLHVGAGTAFRAAQGRSKSVLNYVTRNASAKLNYADWMHRSELRLASRKASRIQHQPGRRPIGISKKLTLDELLNLEALYNKAGSTIAVSTTVILSHEISTAGLDDRNQSSYGDSDPASANQSVRAAPRQVRRL